MKRYASPLLIILLAFFIFGGLPLTIAQDQPNAVGHWEGSISLPGAELEIAIDLAFDEDDKWAGDIDIPAQGAKDVPLGGISVKGSTVIFGMQGVPGNPSFEGKLSQDGKTISGILSQQGQKFPFKLERKAVVENAEPSDENAEPSDPFGKTPDKGVPGEGLEGAWQGSIKLRIGLNVSKSPDGILTGTMDSIDQGAMNLPIDTISHEGTAVNFEMKQLMGTYEGMMNAHGSEISGTWTQAGQAMPLTFKPKTDAPSADNELEGAWEGTLELRVVIKVSETSDKELTGTFDSPDQGAVDLPISRITHDEGLVYFELKQANASFEGMMSEDGSEIAGDWQQGNIMPLTFKRLGKAPEPNRPQEPSKPYPYDEEEVAYRNKAADVKIAGTLTLPRSVQAVPAVLLIPGFEAPDRDGKAFGHKPLLVLADNLTRNGIAVLRVDNRGTGESTGSVGEATPEDFTNDVLAGIAYLKERKEINAKQIGLIGHSHSSLIAPLVATKSADVAFLVLMAGPGVTGEELLYLQNKLVSEASGLNEDLIAMNRALLEHILGILKEEKDNEAAKGKIFDGLFDLVEKLPDKQADRLAAMMPMINAQLESQLEQMLSPWFRFFLTYDPKPTLMQVQCPVLAIYGERDLQIPTTQHLPAIKSALEAGGNKDYTATELPNLNHMFQTSETGVPAEYAKIEETIAPAALETVSDWILKLTVEN